MASSYNKFHHGYKLDLGQLLTGQPTTTTTKRHTHTLERRMSYRFYPHFHPYAPDLTRRLLRQSVKGLQSMDTEDLPGEGDTFFRDGYGPTSLVEQPYPQKTLDFTSSGPYAMYNWELFFHIPFTIAVHLSKNQRFEEAQRWFHFVFDPTDNSDGPTPQRFWRVKPFQQTDVQLIEEILTNLSTGADPQLRQDTINSIEAWKDAPFRPHVIARYRQSAYMLKTVMAYLDNLIDWGDSLFREDTGESINESQQLYVLAANILGTRPQAVPRKGSIRPQTYANLKKDLDALGNVLRSMESEVGFDVAPLPSGPDVDERFSILRSIGRSLYFCVPQNEKLLSYWDTVADRLFKIRNSLNLQGVFRQLPLFEPPIDPALLAKAAAAGLDVAGVVAGLNQPLSPVRFTILLQKAVEICQEVKSLGGQLLSAIEKEDNEALAILRAKHERSVLALADAVKYAQWQESIKSREGLEQSLQNSMERYVYFERQLGKQSNDIKLPEMDALAAEGLWDMKFSAKEPQMELRNIDISIAQGIEEAGGKIISIHEAEELSHLATAHDIQKAVKIQKLAGQAISLLPQFGIKFHFWGLGGDTSYGGFNLGKMANFAADIAAAIADEHNYEASMAGRINSFARREQDWAYQSNQLAGEISQQFKQLRTAQIREAITQREWENHQQQMRNAQEIEFFLTGEKQDDWKHKMSPKEKKAADKALYTWMKREAKALFNRSFQFAYEVAKKAERAMQHELGDVQSKQGFIQSGHMAGKEGLLAGEKLYLDLKRMDMAYLEQNKRELEITQHISLLQLSPEALLSFKATGKCEFEVPEWLYDLHCPGHFFRRIKSVALSIPCVSGPYAGVHCSLRLVGSKIRIQSSGQPYADQGVEDDRFSPIPSSQQSIVTSSAQNDSGLFETNLRDERYLPFEGAGAISKWQLELPEDLRSFDYLSIADVVLHIRYTAREGVAKVDVNTHLLNLFATNEQMPMRRLFSLRHEFSNEWHQQVATGQLKLTLSRQHFPYLPANYKISLQKASLFRIRGQNLEVFGAIPLPNAMELTGQIDHSELSVPLPEGAVREEWIFLIGEYIVEKQI